MAKRVKKSEKKSGHQIALAVISSIILIIIIVSLVNVGLSIFLESPNYEDYCTPKSTPFETRSSCEAIGGQWQDYNAKPVLSSDVSGYCDTDYTCRKGYEEAQKSFNQIRYYVFAGLGLILLLIGMFAIMHTIQYTGLGSGGILLLEGIVTNLENKVMVFVSLLLTLVVFGFLVFKKIEKK